MAKNDKAAAAQNAQASADQDLLDKLLADGGTELRLERTIYAAEACGDVPLCGFIVDLLDMPAIEGGKNKQTGEMEMRDWKAFVFRATYATKGLDREKNVVDVEPGEEIIIPATFQIEAALGRFARDPKVMHEIALKPKAKIDLGGGKTMWQYRVIATKKTEERGMVYALSGAKVEEKAPAMLPSADGKSMVNQQTGEAIPVAAAAS